MLKEVVPDWRAMLGDECFAVGDAISVYEYHDGKKTNKQIAVKIPTFWQKVWRTEFVKILGEVPVYKFDGKPIRLIYEDLRASIYLKNGEYLLSLVADSASIAKKDVVEKLKLSKGE